MNKKTRNLVKKVLSFCLVACLIVTPVKSFAAEQNQNASAGFSYVVNADLNSVTLTGYNGSEQEVVVPETIEEKKVTCLKGTFANRDKITKVTLPSTVEQIDASAFIGCNALQQFVVSTENTKYFTDEVGALYEKENNVVTIVRFPVALQQNNGYEVLEGTQRIADYAFAGTWNCKWITISKSVTSIGNYAFYGIKQNCDKIVFENGSQTATIGTYAFSNMANVDVTLPASVTSLGVYCFANSVNRDFVIVNCKNLKVIPAYCFYKCTNMHFMKLPEGIVKIDGYAFAENENFNTVDLPKTLRSLGEGAFKGCNNFHSIKVPEGVTAIQNGTFDGCQNLNDVILPDSLKVIGDNAFNGCQNIHKLVIPPNVVKVSNTSFKGVDLSKIDASKNHAIAKALGIEKESPSLVTSSFVLKQGKSAKIKLNLAGDQVKSYGLLNKASKKRITVTKTGKIKAKSKKKGKTGSAKVKVTMKSGKVLIANVYVTKYKIYKVKTNKTYKVKKGSKIHLCYGNNTLKNKYSIAKKMKKYISINKYGVVSVKKKTKKTVKIIIKTDQNKTIYQKIKVK